MRRNLFWLSDEQHKRIELRLNLELRQGALDRCRGHFHYAPR
jgi:hypothetical protein